jgi:luciferase family oxidoreductase group 1
MLGSTDGGARIAAKLGLPFVFAHHFHPHFTEPALELYRALFTPSDLLDAPRAIVAAGIVVGDDDDEALRRALPGGVSMLRLRQGRPAPIPSIADAEALIATLGQSELAVVEDAIARAIVGGIDTVHRELFDLAERTGADELMLMSQVPNPDARIEGLERIAEAFELTPAPAARR